MRFTDLAARVRATPPRLGRTRLVAVDGPAGSGKTTFAAALAAALGSAAHPAPVVHLDDLYDGWTLAGVVQRLRTQVLDPVAAGHDARFAAYDWAVGAFRVPTTVPAGEVLLVEGCGSGARALDDVRGLLVWVQAPPATCAQRWADRDGAAMTVFQPAWAAEEAAVFAAEDTRARADLRVDGAPAQPAAPGVFVPL
ncbi:AAA domain-containing protein [Klenkia marina]|uniref:AAA domain-containing protein n=1 Tax=Klenkia marina TaxID=1960309 RepID=A0A1G4YCN6_9ACTN|nr:AAA family ATPase [Klenkia marina]SCX51172.1 AAA domain-containing protein [Klenkia marina]